MPLALLLMCAGTFAQDPPPPEADGQRGNAVDTIPVNVDKAAEGPSGEAPREERTAMLFMGIGLSKVSTDFDNLDDAVNLDVSFGSSLPVIDWLAGEIDLSFTLIPGQNSGPQRCTESPPSAPDPLLGGGEPGSTECEPGNFARSDNEFQLTNIGAFTVLRTPGRFYGVGKVGYRFISSSIAELQEDDRHGVAYALGAGYRWGRSQLAGVELLATHYSSQIDYLGVNVTYGFGSSPSSR